LVSLCAIFVGGCTPILKIEKLEEVSPGFREITTVFDMRKEKGNKIKSWKPKEPARCVAVPFFLHALGDS